MANNNCCRGEGNPYQDFSAHRYQEHMRQNPDGTSTCYNFQSPPQQQFDSDEMRGSMQKILADNIGEYVVVEFLIGTEIIMRKQGILLNVGTSFVTLFDELVCNFIVCDIFSIKFVYFYQPGDRPPQNFNLLPGSGGNGNNNRMR